MKALDVHLGWYEADNHENVDLSPHCAQSVCHLQQVAISLATIKLGKPLIKTYSPQGYPVQTCGELRLT